MKKFAYLMALLGLGFAGASARAACVNLSNATNWSNINIHKVILYQGSKAIAILEIPYCDIFPESSIRFDKADICNGDSIIVSGVACRIRNIERP